jgi:hypothetical protein
VICSVRSRFNLLEYVQWFLSQSSRPHKGDDIWKCAHYTRGQIAYSAVDTLVEACTRDSLKNRLSLDKLYDMVNRLNKTLRVLNILCR